MGLLNGKVAIVTGAGGGIGREHALALAAEGAAVVVNDLGGARDGSGADGSLADAVVDEIRSAGGEAVASHASVATVEGGRSILDAALAAFDQVDLLVNNAGILRDKSFANTSEELWDSVISVHLKGTYCVTRPIFVHMKERARGGAASSTPPPPRASTATSVSATTAPRRRGSRASPAVWPSRGRSMGIRCFILAPVALSATHRGSAGFRPTRAEGKRCDPEASCLPWWSTSRAISPRT